MKISLPITKMFQNNVSIHLALQLSHTQMEWSSQIHSPQHWHCCVGLFMLLFSACYFFQTNSTSFPKKFKKTTKKPKKKTKIISIVTS